MLKYILAFFVGLLLLQTVIAQQVNTLYFLENVPQRHEFNPAIQPLSSFYLSLPIVGNFQFNAGNNSLTASSLNLRKTDLYNSLKPITNVNVAADINLLGFGFRTRSNYFNFTITSKNNVNLSLPKDLLHLGIIGNVRYLNGVPQLENNIFDLSGFGLSATSYIEAALGYSRNLNEKWAAGIKLKYLHGLAAGKAGFDTFGYVTGINEWTLDLDGSANYAIPDMNTFTVNKLLQPVGVGGAVDLGVTFRPNDKLVFGAAVTDLGMINWTKSPLNYRAKVNFKLLSIAGFTFDELINGVGSNSITNGIQNDLIDSLHLSNSAVAFSTPLTPRINLSGEYGFMNNTVSLGLLSTTFIYKNSVQFGLTPSLNLHPANWLNFALSYSVFNARASNIGLGLGVRIGIFNTFVTADYIPLNFAPLNAPVSLVPASVPGLSSVTLSRVPAKTERLNFAVGFNIVFGNKQDKDRDGISNQRDKCPDTPHGVIVDKKGCPLDTDGDSIPDYYDKCPDTPKAAYSSIDSDGCPLDTDGDGVFDYLDKCPNTPYQAYGTVDKNGCPKDTDNDSVPDYLDKCPQTPIAERNNVDSLGCTIVVVQPVVLDTVPVDSLLVGAELLNTVPVNTVPVVDGKPVVVDGKPVDVDGKSVVADVDTDDDGIVDRLDRCPQLAGVASNDGCPEIKKEVRVIFQKALQGIQFETAKFIIKPLSYVILQNVARVLSENPTYMVEIQGHTDNAGLAEKNQILSKNRANAVRDYLISKGVDASRLTAKGYGQMRPVAPNSTIEGRAKNRRVEFVVSFE